MDILKIAEHSGMQIILNGRIGREEYRSVCGSIQALRRFADTLLASKVSDTEDVRPAVETGRSPRDQST
jgi:hypothetical protein